LESDSESVRASLDGHPEAYAVLVQRYQAPLVGYLANRRLNPDEAAEIAQEVFVRSWLRLGELRKSSAFAPWLFGIADRTLKESLRAKQRRKHQPLTDAVPAAPQPPPGHDGVLQDAVARLDEPYRQVIVLRFFGKMSCEHVAQALGVPLGTVTKRLSRAYAILREQLGSREARA
jgi:RNA polymerase sigma-70 factor (ECF subfamily)